MTRRGKVATRAKGKLGGGLSLSTAFTLAAAAVTFIDVMALREREPCRAADSGKSTTKTSATWRSKIIIKPRSRG